MPSGWAKTTAGVLMQTATAMSLVPRHAVMRYVHNLAVVGTLLLTGRAECTCCSACTSTWLCPQLAPRVTAQEQFQVPPVDYSSIDGLVGFGSKRYSYYCTAALLTVPLLQHHNWYAVLERRGQRAVESGPTTVPCSTA